MDKETGVITLVTKLDFESQTTYEMIVVASDFGSPALRG